MSYYLKFNQKISDKIRIIYQLNFVLNDKNMCVILFIHIPFYFIFPKRLWHCFTKIFIYFILNIPKNTLQLYVF